MDFENLIADTEDILTVHYSEGRQGHAIDKVIVHYNDGNLSVEDCYRVWQSREASAHYQVEESGRIGQLVWDADTSWNCGKWVPNCESIGIEHANQPDGTITDACLDAGSHLVAAVCKKYGLGRPEWLTNVFPHCYFVSTSCPGEIYGSQKDAYMASAQRWYDSMTGSADAPTGTAGTGAGAPTEGEDMECIVNFNNTGKLVWIDGAGAPHWLDEPDTAESVRMVYRLKSGGREIPEGTIGDEGAPWMSRYLEAHGDGSAELPSFASDHK